MVEIALPPRGYLARRFIELSVMFLRGINIEGDKLVITSCLDFHQSLLENIDKVGRGNLFLTVNDRRHVVSKIAGLLGVSSGSRATAVELLKALADVAKGRIKEECVPGTLVDELTTINILKANFYEYGKTYLAKPDVRYVTLDKLPIISQLLGMLGILLADVGMIVEEGIHYYVLPPEGVSREVVAVRKDEILRYFRTAQEILNLKRYFNAPRALLVLKLATELVRAGCEEDIVTAELVSIQEKGNRATVMSIEPVSTEGLVHLISLTGDVAREVSTKLGILADIAVRSQDKTKDVVTSVATHMLAYSRTGSLEALYLAIALVARLSEHVIRGTKEFSSLVSGLRERGIERQVEWLSRLAGLMSKLVGVE